MAIPGAREIRTGAGLLRSRHVDQDVLAGEADRPALRRPGEGRGQIV
jgi:hypothetical protein